MPTLGVCKPHFPLIPKCEPPYLTFQSFPPGKTGSGWIFFLICYGAPSQLRLARTLCSIMSLSPLAPLPTPGALGRPRWAFTGFGQQGALRRPACWSALYCE